MIKFLSAFHREVLDFISFWCLGVPKVVFFWLGMIITTAYVLFIVFPLYWICGADASVEVTKLLSKGKE